jgi:hypothetical protein
MAARKKAAAKKAAAPKPPPTQAEIDYGTGARTLPPLLHEMSPTSQQVVSDAYKKTMSNMQTHIKKKAKTSAEARKLKPSQVAALQDTTVGISEAGANIAAQWENVMQSSSERPGSQVPAWYFGGRRRLGGVADTYPLDVDDVIDASAAMSPRNSPNNEHRAASAMADAVANRRMVTHPEYGKRRLSSMSLEEFNAVVPASEKNVVSSAPDFAFDDIRLGGVKKEEGWRTLTDPDYNAVEQSESTKVPYYAHAYRLSVPDSPLHREYIDRFYDQEQARRVRKARENDVATGASTIRGVPDRVDLDGLKYVGSKHSFDHEILGTQGISVPDSWMNAIASGQQLLDTEVGDSSPAKAAMTLTSTNSSSPSGSTFMSPEAVNSAGGKSFTDIAAHGVATMAAVQEAAKMAREEESETNIPPIMMQEMPWKHVRHAVADSHDEIARELGKKPNTARTNVLRSGGLEEESELRPANPEAARVSIAPGSFFRGFEDPINSDSVTVLDGPAPYRSQPATPSAPRWSPSTEVYSDDQKRAAIIKAQQSRQR